MSLESKQEIMIFHSDRYGYESVKCQFSNAPPDTGVEQFAQMSCSRYWIERAFEDGKGIVVSSQITKSVV